MSITTFKELRAKDSALGKIAPQVDRKIPEAVGRCSLAKSLTVLSQLVTSLESLKNGHLDLAEAGNLYSANVILRVFLEHSLKSMAIFVKATLHDDTLAEAYLRLAEVEAKLYLKALVDAGIDEKEMADSPLSPLFGKAKLLEKTDKEMLEGKFRYKSLIETIRESIGDEEAHVFLRKIIPSYSELSGFVHGGPSASTISQCLGSECVGKLLEDASLVTSMFYSIKRYLLILATELQPEFLESYNELDEAIELVDR